MKKIIKIISLTLPVFLVSCVTQKVMWSPGTNKGDLVVTKRTTILDKSSSRYALLPDVPVFRNGSSAQIVPAGKKFIISSRKFHRMKGPFVELYGKTEIDGINRTISIGYFLNPAKQINGEIVVGFPEQDFLIKGQ